MVYCVDGPFLFWHSKICLIHRSCYSRYHNQNVKYLLSQIVTWISYIISIWQSNKRIFDELEVEVLSHQSKASEVVQTGHSSYSIAILPKKNNEGGNKGVLGGGVSGGGGWMGYDDKWILRVKNPGRVVLLFNPFWVCVFPFWQFFWAALIKVISNVNILHEFYY